MGPQKKPICITTRGQYAFESLLPDLTFPCQPHAVGFCQIQNQLISRWP